MSPMNCEEFGKLVQKDLDGKLPLLRRNAYPKYMRSCRDYMRY